MGWKYTASLTRADALELIEDRLSEATDRQLSDALTSLGYGDEEELPYYGANFCIED